MQQLVSGAGECKSAGLDNIAVVGYFKRKIGVLLVEKNGDARLVDGNDDIKDIAYDKRCKSERRLIHHN